MDSKDNKIFKEASPKPIKDAANRGADGRFIKGNLPLTKKYTADIPDKLLDYYLKHKDDIKLASDVDFCVSEGLMYPTFANWLINPSPEYDRLRNIHAYCKELQAAQIVSGAMNRTFDPGFAQFLLKAKHGYRDKQEISLDSKSEGKIDVNIKVIE